MSGDRRVVLVVEDSAQDRAMVRRLLREDEREFEVVERASGREGLEYLEEGEAACVLLDYYLPDLNGSEFMAELARRGGGASTVPVVLLTGHEDAQTASEVLNLGAQDYILKGTVSGPGLVRVIANAIERFSIQRELEQKRAALELRNWELETLQRELQDKVVELADATQAKDQFLAVMSHEMRTPLNAILGYVDLMYMGLGGELSDVQKDHLDRVRTGGRHLLDLINDLLDLARADAQRLDLDLRAVDLRAVLEEVSGLLQSQAAEKGIDLRNGCGEEEVPLVHADLQRVRQVLTNLIGNAIKFTAAGEVTISCRHEGGEVIVSVSDTGIGIDEDALPFIFNEFFQAEGALTRTHGGTGLGLAIAQRLTRLMGGEIRVSSQAGSGSLFELVLACAPEGSERRGTDIEHHDARMEELAFAHTHAEPGTAPVVLAYAEDGDALRALAEQLAPGVNLVWATESRRVVSLAREEQPSLIILDVSGKDGAAWRLAHALQDDEEVGQPAILLLPELPSGGVQGDGADGGLDLGWVSLVPKPFSQDQITSAVSRAANDVREARGEEHTTGFEVLVVDDDPDSRRVASEFLGNAGAVVRDVADGESALVAMRRRPPDVVVLDLMMPVLDGFGVLAAMRADPQLAAIPVVVLSAKTLTEAERQFLARTAIRVLQKGQHRLADVAALVMRAATGTRPPAGAGEAEPSG
jgi:signal transduction histidine kinase